MTVLATANAFKNRSSTIKRISRMLLSLPWKPQAMFSRLEKYSSNMTNRLKKRARAVGRTKTKIQMTMKMSRFHTLSGIEENSDSILVEATAGTVQRCTTNKYLPWKVRVVPVLTSIKQLRGVREDQSQGSKGLHCSHLWTRFSFGRRETIGQRLGNHAEGPLNSLLLLIVVN